MSATETLTGELALGVQVQLRDALPVAGPPAEMTDETQDALLAQLEELIAEAGETAPQIWAACEAEALRRTGEEIRQGKRMISSTLADDREVLARQLALEQLIGYGRAQGLEPGKIAFLIANVLGAEAYTAVQAGEPPERAVIDDLRCRIYVLTNFTSSPE